MSALFPGISKLKGSRAWKPGEVLSLTAIKAVLEELDNPHLKLRIIHVAGTNGKGSVCAFLGGILGKAGFNVGITISPHLTNVSERIVINGSSISDPHLDLSLREVFAAADSLNVELTDFEALVAAAFLAFAYANLDYVVIETGLGGVWDATNVVTPVASVITTISYDHEETLGRTISDIATQKAGIIKPGVPVFIGHLPVEALEVLQEAALACGSKCFTHGVDFTVEGNVYRDNEGGVILLEPSLVGDHQIKNSALAARVARYFSVDVNDIELGVKQVFWPARLEWCLYGEHKLLFDAGHNVQGIESICEYLHELNGVKPRVIFGALKTKRWQEMINQISPYVSEWGIFEPESLQKVSGADMVGYLSSNDIKAEWLKNNEDVLNFIMNGESQTPILVCGSMYMIGGVRKLLQIPDRALWTISGKRNLSGKISLSKPSLLQLKHNIYNELHGLMSPLPQLPYRTMVEYLLDLPGKLLRPLLCSAIEMDLRHTSKTGPALGAALELLHISTLIHDDLPPVDNSPVRRGAAALHVKFGEGAALLAADALVGSALKKAAASSLAGVYALAEAYEKVSIGQILDISSGGRDPAEINRLKTGTLFEVACLLGAYAAEVRDPETQKQYASFGLSLGEAFQLLDDIDDYEIKNSPECSALTAAYLKAKEVVFDQLQDLKRAANNELALFSQVVHTALAK